jgi:site-specific recombinase XerD
VVAWRNEMQKKGLAAATIMRRLAALNMFCRECIAEGYLELNPASSDRIKWPIISQISPHHALTNQQVRDLLSQPDRTIKIGKRDYALLMLLVYCGLRRAEATGLTLGSIGHERKHITLRILGKGDKERLIVLPLPVHEAIEEYLHASGRKELPNSAPLFVPLMPRSERMREKLMANDTLWRLVKKYALQAGIPSQESTTHVLRHTAATNALDNGATIRRVQHMLGHADIKTTTRYDSRRGDLDHCSTKDIDYSW